MVGEFEPRQAHQVDNLSALAFVASIIFGRANRGLLAEALSDGGGGCIGGDRNKVKVRLRP
jgi:hypothetical protein